MTKFLRIIALGLLWFAAGARGDDVLGRLFYSPAERHDIDAAHDAAVAPAVPTLQPTDIAHLEEPEVELSPAPAPLPTLTLQGIVKRRDGPSTVWLNGVAQDPRLLQLPGLHAPRAQMRRDGVSIAQENSPHSIELKVGETIAPTPESPMFKGAPDDGGAQ